MNHSITNSQSHSKQMPFPDSSQIDLLSVLSNFIKRRNEIIQKTTQIYLQTQSEEKRAFELRKLIFTKPILQEAISIQNLLKNTNSTFTRQILQDLTSDIELSLYCLQSLQNFVRIQNSLSQAEKISQTSLMIELTWQQIYRLSIYDPVLINAVSKLEWVFRAFEVLNHPRTDSKYPYIEYCEILIKGALASQSKEIMANRFYKRIEEEVQIYKSLFGKVVSMFNGNSDSAQKMDIEEAKKLIQELKQFGFGMNQYAESIEEILKRAVNLVAKFNEFLRKKVLISANDLKEFVIQIQRFPVRLSKIQEHLAKLYDDQEEQVQVVLQETAQRLNEKCNELTLRYFKESPQSFDASMIVTKEISRACEKELERITRYSQELMQNLQTFKFEDFCILSGQITARGYEDIRAELWLAKVRLLQIFSQNLIKPFNPVTFEQVCGFLPEIESYVNSLPGPKRAPFDEQIGFLYRLLHEIQMWIETERSKQEMTRRRMQDKVFYGFIDVTKEIIQPEKQKKQPENLESHAKGMQFQGQNLESLNGKKDRIGHEAQEIDFSKRIEKKIKTRNEFRQYSIEVDIKQDFQPEIVKIEE